MPGTVPRASYPHTQMRKPWHGNLSNWLEMTQVVSGGAGM